MSMDKAFMDELATRMEKDKTEAAKLKTESVEPDQPEGRDEIPELTISQKLDTLIEEEQWISTTLAGLAANHDGSIKSQFFIKLFRLCYLADGNPIHLWRIYQHCRNHDISIPGYVLKYLDDVAQGLLPSIAGDALRPPVRDDNDKNKDGKQASVAVDEEDEYTRSIVIGTHTAYGADLTMRKVTAALLKANAKTRQKVADIFGIDLHRLDRWIRELRSSEGRG